MKSLVAVSIPRSDGFSLGTFRMGEKGRIPGEAMKWGELDVSSTVFLFSSHTLLVLGRSFCFCLC